MSSYSISFRADEEVKQIIDKIMSENHLKQSEAIRFLAIAYEKSNSNSNSNPYYRNLLAKFSMDMETALTQVAQTGDITYALDVMEGFKCQIL